jgi:hypothetical protein
MFQNTEELIKKVLIEPALNGCNELRIVSGFATSNMANRHLMLLTEAGVKVDSIKIDLILGMAPREGVERPNHSGFLDLNKSNKVAFKCHYVTSAIPVHSKVYVWCNGSKPHVAFLGSANYTQNAFSTSMREVLAPSNPNEADNYFYNILEDSVSCDEPDIEQVVNIYDSKNLTRGQNSLFGGPTPKLSLQTNLSVSSVKLSLMSKRQGDVPGTSGLNWGQRDGRDPSQAYLAIPSEIYKTAFFPPRGSVFTLLTDDDKSIVCVRAQDNGKAIHSTLSNALLGEYFRSRLGLKRDQKVELKHLTAYGRADVTISKIDDETYFLDFSVV